MQALIENARKDPELFAKIDIESILNEQNDPSPVLLENPWSEWKPLDK
jgi:hypothetical protein